MIVLRQLSILRKTVIMMVIAIFVYVIFIAFSDFLVIYDTIRNFPLEIIPLILSFAVMSSFIRAIRYHLYLKILKINIKFANSIMIYFAGLSMEFTPVRIGQVITSYILKEKFNKPITQTASPLIIERITDLVGLVIISTIGILIIGQFSWVIGIAIVVLLSVIILTQKSRPFYSLANFLIRFHALQNIIENLKEMYGYASILTRKKNLTIASLLSTLAWTIEALGIFAILKAIGAKIEFFESLLAYTKSAFIGGLSFIPNGVGISDTTFVSFLLPYGIDFAVATTVMILTRLHFTWFRVVLGFIFLKITFPKAKLNYLS